MGYKLQELFSNFKEINTNVEEDSFILSKIKEYVNWDKPDFVALVAPFRENKIPFQRNIRLDFNSHDESLITVMKHVLASQIEMVNEIDKRTIQFLFEVDSSPMDLLLKLRFNVELEPGNIRTFLRKTHVVIKNKEGKPEVGLLGITDLTQLAPNQKVLFELKIADDSSIDDKKRDEFLEDIEKIIEHKVRLTKREIEILKEINKGKTSLEIAQVLNIAKSTVDTHRQNMIKKYKVPNITSLLHEVKSMGRL